MHALVTSYGPEVAKEDVGSNSTAPHYEYGIAYARRPAPRKFASFFLSRDPATPCRKSSLVPLLPTSWWFCNLSRQIWHEMIQTKIACHGNKKSHGMYVEPGPWRRRLRYVHGSRAVRVPP